MSFSEDIVDAMRGFVDRRIREVFVCLPGRVVTYDQSTQKCSVQPSVKRARESEEGSTEYETLSIIEDVPVQFLGAGDFTITFPVTKGTDGMIMFSQADIGKWVNSSGGVSTPETDRHHDINDAIFIPGLRTFRTATDQVDGSAMVIAGDEIKIGSKDAADPVVRQSDLTTLKTWLDTHVHTGVTTGAGVSGAVAPAAQSPTVTGSTKVKVD